MTATPAEYRQHTRTLNSEIARIRGRAFSDPSRPVDLIEALLKLNAHLIRGHQYTEAAGTAQEALTLAAKQLTADGPIGVYTQLDDAVRFITATAHLAWLQSQLELHPAAEQLIAMAMNLPEHLDVPAHTPAEVLTWLQLAKARAALADERVSDANGWADLAGWQLASLPDEPDSFLPIDVHRTLSQTRWAVGYAQDSILHALRAKELYDRLVADRLAGADAPTRARLGEPAGPLHDDLALKLRALGDLDQAVHVRRQLVAVSGPSARTALAAELVAGGRAEEASLLVDAAPEPTEAAPLPAAASWAVPEEAFGVRPDGAAPLAAEMVELAGRLAAWRQAASAAEAEERDRAARQLAQRAQQRAEAERAAEQAAEQERLAAERAAAEAAAAERAAQAEREARAEAERVAAKQAREQRMREHAEAAEQRRLAELAEHRSDSKRRRND